MIRPRVVFMGTSEFAVPALRAVAAACDLAAVVTRPDRPRGRGQVVAQSPVGATATELGAPLLRPASPSEPDTRDALGRLAPDLFAVVAYGAILGPELLRIPRLGCINLHGSALPDYRGASPVQRALWDGRGSTGVTTLWMDEGIDTGDLILQRWAPIRSDDDAGSLARRLAELGAPLLAESLALAARSAAPRQPQERGAGSYARKLAKQDGVVNWDLEVEAVWHRQRAVTPWPGATTTLRGKPVLLARTRPLHGLATQAPPGTILGIQEEGVVVACARGALLVLALRPEGRGERGGAEWARGARLVDGERFAVEAST